MALLIQFFLSHPFENDSLVFLNEKKAIIHTNLLRLLINRYLHNFLSELNLFHFLIKFNCGNSLRFFIKMSFSSIFNLFFVRFSGLTCHNNLVLFVCCSSLVSQNQFPLTLQILHDVQSFGDR